MPTHAEKKLMPFTRDQLFDMVADVEKYPQFLPWCVASRIKKRDGNIFWADLMIGFKVIRERFTSRVELNRDKWRIDVKYSDGPFHYLNNHWIFEEQPDGSTRIDFFVDFEFKNRLLQGVMGALFNEAVRLMVHSFEKRAGQLYGPDGRKSRP